jgi:glycosyltransferase involved in cell wall biosynthesis
LFDRNFMLATQIDLAASGVDILQHFHDYGWVEGRWPNPYFDPQYYIASYPDVRDSGMNPLLHYIMHGEAEGRRPCPHFQPGWYREYFDVPASENALSHFLRHRHLGEVSPVPEFDASFYCNSHPDIAAAGIDPFEHYINFGWKEGRNPSGEFDGRWYSARYLQHDPAANPFLHWMAHRGELGIHGRMPPDEPTIPREVKHWTRPAAEFEDVRPLASSIPRRAKILAYYLPQFHAFAENDAWWGQGFTEWTNLPRGLPRFKGHYQPRIPRDLGFYALDAAGSNDMLRRQARLARGGGLHGFVFYHYWFNGKRLMDGPVDRLLADPTIDLPFALMWANENWTRRWDGAESEVLISQDYRPEDDAAMLADFARHFRDPRYIRVKGGRPLLMIYRPGIIPDGRAAVDRWRAMFRNSFGEDPVLVMAQAFGDTDPRDFGMDAAVEFPPHKLTQNMQPVNQQVELLDHEFAGKVYHYEEVVGTSLQEAPADFPLIKCAFPAWDNDARRQGNGLVVTGSTPARYQAWLDELVVRAQRAPVFGESLVCINAWNEWCEGTYLEPDLHWGAAYLNATARAVAGITPSGEAKPGILLVGHDAFPSGAQALLLEIGRTLKRRHGARVEFLLLSGGAMEAAYQAAAPVTILPADGNPAAILQGLAGRGLRRALLNTSVSGGLAPQLQEAGIVPETMLVHELPRLLREKHLVEHARRGVRHARRIVFPARFVRDAVEDLLGEVPVGEVLVQPQGSYKDLAAGPGEADAFRRSFGIPARAHLVLGVGYADLRKGIDLFLQCWRLMEHEAPGAHFLWAGQVAPEVEAWMGQELVAAQATGRFHLPGRLVEVAPAFAAADAFLLTSREDPFPTVALEAMSLGKPVLAFAGTGGIPELLDETGLGETVPLGDTVALALALAGTLAVKGRAAKAASEARRSLVRERFAFAPYVSRLLHQLMPGLPRVSVAVPNYNYARFMPERLGSVFRQTLPVEEVLVLDDVSTDASLEVIPAVAAEWDREIRLVANETNSGSVFAQWRKAAEMATGDWLWIAEADDTSDPEFLAKVLALAADDPAVVMGFSDSRTIEADGRPQWDSYKGYYATVEPGALSSSEVFDGAAFVTRFLAVKNLILNVSSVVWRRDALLRALDASEAALLTYKMAGDWQLYLQALTEPGARLAYQAEPLNVHRRHAQSVTHALDGERHVAEIVRCHSFARERVAGLAKARGAAQGSYLEEVTRQLGVRPKPAPSQQRLARTKRK